MNSISSDFSRYRSNNSGIFDVFCEVACSEGQAADILYKFPREFQDEDVLKSIRRFSLPTGDAESFDHSEQEEHYHFVLTDVSGKFTFGYCRYSPISRSILCILTPFAWDEGFRVILDELALCRNKPVSRELVLKELYEAKIPEVGEIFHVSSEGSGFQFVVPDLSKLPPKKSKNAAELSGCLTSLQLIAVYASLLKERRLLFTSSRLSRLTRCIKAATSLFFPMNWQGIYVPLLPAELVDMLAAPMPYIIGLPKQILANTALHEYGDIVLVDLDLPEFQSPHEDNLPVDVHTWLKKHLKENDANYMKTFLHATALLFGEFRKGLGQEEESKKCMWTPEKFLSQQINPFRHAYLQQLIGTGGGVQYFERFIEERLLELNSGIYRTDEFEVEIMHLTSKKWKSAKESPSERIIHLKEKVSSKLAKLTPKELRKPKEKKSKRKKSLSLTIDNGHWEEAPSPASKSEQLLAMIDLIDLTSPPASPRVSLGRQSLPPVPLRPNFQLQERRHTMPSVVDSVLYGEIDWKM